MKTKKTPEGTLFILEHSFQGAGKWLFAWYALSLLVPAIFFLWVFFFLSDGTDLVDWFALFLAVAFGIAGYRYLTSAWKRDTLFVGEQQVTLIEQKGFHKRRQQFIRQQIGNLRFLDKPKLTPHPLAGKTFDYLGFETQQQVIGEMFGDHRTAFDYDGQTVSFGRRLYSWDFDLIHQAITGDVPDEEIIQWNTPHGNDEYWQAFENFIYSFSTAHSFIKLEAEAAKNHLNGAPEGWLTHRKALKTLRVRFEDQLTTVQKADLDELIDFASHIINADV